MGRSQRPKGSIAGMGFLERGKLASSRQLGGLGHWGSAISSPSGALSGAPAAKRYSRGAKRHLLKLLGYQVRGVHAPLAPPP